MSIETVISIKTISQKCVTHFGTIMFTYFNMLCPQKLKISDSKGSKLVSRLDQQTSAAKN